MKNKNNFLLEIGTEELPPIVSEEYLVNLTYELGKKLNFFSLSFSTSKKFYTPRRLAILFSDIENKQPDKILNFRGPPVKISYDEQGNPTLAAKKFAERCGIAIHQLRKIKDGQYEFLFHQSSKVGKNTICILPNIIIDTIKNVSMKKSMYWNIHSGPFLRPIRWIVALWGSQIIPLEIFGIKSSNKTYGHRFHVPNKITITSSDRYEEQLLKKGKVIVDKDKRVNNILKQIKKLVQDQAIVPDTLLNFSADITELPKALVGNFDSRFLSMPIEILKTTLEKNQNCFATMSNNKLSSKFIIITNIISKNPSQIISGNERIVSARFTDAEYFYKTDLNIKFSHYLYKLKKISFYEKLGSLFSKSIRLAKLSRLIATSIGISVRDAVRAAILSKCDLSTLMVKEFPELQGIMGYYYAKNTENTQVIEAIRDQYLPKSYDDCIPQNNVGCVLSIADRIDTIVGLFSLNRFPDGNKDPYGLRRITVGMLNIILKCNFNLDLKKILINACQNYNITDDIQETLISKILHFIYERLFFMYREQKKYDISILRAVLALLPTDIIDFDKRVIAIQNFINQSDAILILSIYKRIKNIIKQDNIENIIYPFDKNLVITETEQQLVHSFEHINRLILSYYYAKEYHNVLITLGNFTRPVQKFFEQNIVMTNDIKIKNNRIAILHMIYTTFNLVANWAYINIPTSTDESINNL